MMHLLSGLASTEIRGRQDGPIGYNDWQPDAERPMHTRPSTTMKHLANP